MRAPSQLSLLPKNGHVTWELIEQCSFKLIFTMTPCLTLMKIVKIPWGRKREAEFSVSKFRQIKISNYYYCLKIIKGAPVLIACASDIINCTGVPVLFEPTGLTVRSFRWVYFFWVSNVTGSLDMRNVLHFQSYVVE